MMRVLLDTNVVARLLPRVGSNIQGIAANAVTNLRTEHHELFLVPQVLYEFWVIATRPAAQNGFGLSTTDATRDLSRLQKLFTLLRDERSVFDRWEALVDQHQVIGKGAHGARLVAAMNRHALSHLLTFNVVDFKRYPTIQLLDAQELGASTK
jgi:hypothetical protein